MSVLGKSKVLEMSMDDAVARVTEVLAKSGFGVLTTIDSQAVIKKKLGLDMPAYKILGACNPKFAHKAITLDPTIGILLPCNVVVRENEAGKIEVIFTDVYTKFAGYKDSPHFAELGSIAKLVDEGIMKAFEEL